MDFSLNNPQHTQYCIISKISQMQMTIITLAVFLDLYNAFDSIGHDIQQYQLYHYEIGGVSNKWVFSYLCNHRQHIEMNDCKSPLIKLTHGVPQGSA